ncbi:MAG: PorT family protein [Flavobacteriaceae bacterium]|nr:PorT family protein [Flavobacteriaceae bacterium]
MKNQPQIIFLFFLLFSSSFIQAQDYFVGVKGGVNYNTIGDLYHLGDPSHLYGSSPIPLIDLAYSPNNEMGNHYGIYVTADFGNFFVRPELNFTSMKSSYGLSRKTSNWSSSKIEIPILIGYNIYKPVSIYAGPVFSSISDRELEGLRIQTPLQTIKFDKNTTGISAGVLVQYKRFGLDIRYVYDITAIKQQQIIMIVNTYGTFVADLVEYNPSQLSVSLTIDLFHFTFDKTARTKARYDWRNHKNLR